MQGKMLDSLIEKNSNVSAGLEETSDELKELEDKTTEKLSTHLSSDKTENLSQLKEFVKKEITPIRERAENVKETVKPHKQSAISKYNVGYLENKHAKSAKSCRLKMPNIVF